MFEPIAAFLARLRRLGQIESALAEAEEKFDRIVGPVGTMSRDVAEIKNRLGKEPTDEAKSIIRFLAFSSLAGALAACLGFYEIGVAPELLYDFLSYTLPVLAAGYAGLGLYFRNERLWYLGSCLLLLFGIICFMLSKYSESVVGWMVVATMYGVSVVAGAALLFVFHKRVRRKRTTIWTFANGVAYWLLFFAAIVDFAAINVTLEKIVNYKPEEKTLKCRQDVSTKTGSSTLICDSKM